MTQASSRAPISLRIERIVFPGKSLGRREGKVVFTDEGLPGELVEVEVTRERPDFVEGRTISVREASPDRTPARCDHYRACAPYQVLDYPLQLEVKKEHIREMLGRKFDLDPARVVARPSPRTWGYRNRARFHLAGKPGSLTLAYNRPGSLREFVPVKACYLLSEGMNGLLSSALDILNASRTGSVKGLEVRETASGSEALLILSGGKFRKESLPRSLVPELKKSHPLAGLIWLGETSRATTETIVYGRDEIEERFGGVRYRLGARSFFQVNRYLLEEALSEIRSTAREAGVRRVADLYCGVGTFGLALASTVEWVEGIESDPVNLGLLRRNIPLNDFANFAVRPGTAEQGIREALAAKPDLVIVDPPRKGLSLPVTAGLREDPPRRLLYLSCDPATQARDLAILGEIFVLDRLTIFDFFPHTPHIETLAVLDRR